MSPITTPVGFATTAAEAVAGIDMSGKRAIVTGGASGIGVDGAGARAVLRGRAPAAPGRVRRPG